VTNYAAIGRNGVSPSNFPPDRGRVVLLAVCENLLIIIVWLEVCDNIGSEAAPDDEVDVSSYRRGQL